MTSLAQTSSIPVIATGSLQSYLDSIQQIRILERHEEEELFRQFQEEKIEEKESRSYPSERASPSQSVNPRQAQS